MADKDTPTNPSNQEETPASEKLDSIRKFLGTDEPQPQPKTATEDETKPPVKADVPDTETPDEETETETPGLTQDEVNKQVEEAKLQVFNKIKESFGLSEQEQKDMADEGLVAPWEAEQRSPSSWKEVAEYGAVLAEAKEKQKAKEQEKIKEQQQAYQKQQSDAMNKNWDMQLEELRETGKIPKINPELRKRIVSGENVTKEERDADPGLKAQADLFQTMYVVSQDRAGKGKPGVTNMKEVYYEYYLPQQNKDVAGADAPVSGAGAGTQPESDDYSYSDIRSKSFEQIAQDG